MLKKCQRRILHLGKLSFKNERDIKTFPDNQNTSEFITNICFLRESPSIWNERALHSHLKTQEKKGSLVKENTWKYILKNYSKFDLKPPFSFSTVFKDKCIK